MAHISGRIGIVGSALRLQSTWRLWHGGEAPSLASGPPNP